MPTPPLPDGVAMAAMVSEGGKATVLFSGNVFGDVPLLDNG